MADADEDSVLATLPGGARVLSTLRGDQDPPGHVYRVVSSGGTTLREFPTLAALSRFLGGDVPGTTG